MTEINPREVLDTLQKQSRLITELQTKIENRDSCPEVRRQWIPKHEIMQFLGFGNTQMAAITRKYNLVTTTIGKRKFYHVNSLLKILERNQSN